MASNQGLQKSILEDPEAAMSMSELNVEYRMSVDEYKERWPLDQSLRSEQTIMGEEIGQRRDR